MAEAAGVVSAKRSRDDSLMGAFGIPDTGNSKSAAYTGTAGEMTGLLAENGIDSWRQQIVSSIFMRVKTRRLRICL